MDILNLGGINEPSEQPSKKKLKVIIGIGLLAGVMGMGSTLAASITLNGGTSVEFGQGVQYVTACDSAVTLTPVSGFLNGSAGQESNQSNFALTSLAVSNITSSTCIGKKFTLNAYTDSATVGGNYTSDGTIATALGFGESYTAEAANFYSGTYVGTAVNTGCIITVVSLDDYTLTSCNKSFAGGSITLTDNTGGFTLTFARSTVVNGSYARPILAAAVDKFSVESSA
jgi:hypothetical protein